MTTIFVKHLKGPTLPSSFHAIPNVIVIESIANILTGVIFCDHAIRFCFSPQSKELQDTWGIWCCLYVVIFIVTPLLTLLAGVFECGLLGEWTYRPDQKLILDSVKCFCCPSYLALESQERCKSYLICNGGTKFVFFLVSLLICIIKWPQFVLVRAQSSMVVLTVSLFIAASMSWVYLRCFAPPIIQTDVPIVIRSATVLLQSEESQP